MSAAEVGVNSYVEILKAEKAFILILSLVKCLNFQDLTDRLFRETIQLINISFLKSTTNNILKKT